MTFADRLYRSAPSGILIASLLLPQATVAQAVEPPVQEAAQKADTVSAVEPELDEANQPEGDEVDLAADKPDATPRRYDWDYFELLIEADRLHEQGRRAEAEHLYRKAKGSFTGVAFSNRPEPIADPRLLPPAGQVYWREAEAGREAELLTRMMVPLELLVQEYPEFIPATIRYAELLLEQDRPQEALAVLERAATLYPDQAELVRVRVNALAAQDEWLDASIAARQFALFYPEHPAANEFLALADDHQQTFRSKLRSRLTGNAIANVLTGALSFALTGGLFGPISAIDTAVLLLRGEAQVGESVASAAQRSVSLIWWMI
jgi:tetratricopeptide (TPR) repeat protein